MSIDLLEGIHEQLREEELLEILTDLVKVPSENPPGDEREVFEVSKKWLDKLGFESEVFEATEGRINLIATKTWEREGRTVIWSGHYDVVPAGDLKLWRYPPYEPTVIENRIYGRGTADMKGAIASALEAVAILRRTGEQPRGKLVFILSADEETSSRLGMDYLTEKGIIHKGSGDAAIVGEPTGLDVLIAEKGYVWLKISTVGRAAHGSTPELGINAIEKMSKVILKLESMKLKGNHAILGKPTHNIGTIEGGTKINVVPDCCAITIDRRTLPEENAEKVVEDYEQVLDRLQHEDKDFQAEVEMFDYANASEISPEEEVVKLAQQAVASVTDKNPNLGGLSGASDARFLINRCGIPTIICGPGSFKQAHVADEYTTVPEIADAAKVYAFIIGEFLGA
jgi:succinyl-diaminopimelate desuccinylase